MGSLEIARAPQFYIHLQYQDLSLFENPAQTQLLEPCTCNESAQAWCSLYSKTSQLLNSFYELGNNSFKSKIKCF